MFTRRVAVLNRSLMSHLLSDRRLSQGIKVAVLGASGATGQPLSLMLKQSPWFQEVALYDMSSTRGLGMELSHVDTPCAATSHDGPNGLKTALSGSHIVVMLASSHSDDIVSNGKIVAALARACSQHCPQAFICVGTAPVNCMLPVACETYKKSNRSVDPCRMFGLTVLDVVRANTFLSEVVQLPPHKIEVPVIGGSSTTTTVPVLSQAKPSIHLTMEETVKITRAIQEADVEVKKCKECGRATLAAAFAITRFCTSLSKAICGHPNIVECAYVMSNVVPNLHYLSTQLELGQCGVSRSLGVPELTDYECCLMETAMAYLKKDIEHGEQIAAKVSS